MEIDRVIIVAAWLEALFYGINTVLVWSFLFILRRKKDKQRVDKFLICIIVSQYLVSTTDASIGLTRLITGFIDFSDRTNEYLSDMSSPLNVVQLLLIATNSVLNDYIVIWRCHHVWNRDWKVAAFPAILVVGTVVSIVGLGISLCNLNGSHDMFSPKTVPWYLSLYALALSANVISTSLIASRIWPTIHSSSAYFTFLLLLIESGILYSASLIVGLGLYLSRADSFYIVYAQLGQLASIIPTVIVLLVALRITSEQYSCLQRAASTTTTPKCNSKRPEMTINITTTRYTDFGLGEALPSTSDNASESSGA